MRTVLLASTLILLAFTNGLAADDLKGLEGRWLPEEIIANGSKFFDYEFAHTHIRIEGDQLFLYWHPGHEIPTKFTLNLKENPNRIDLVATAKPNLGRKMPGLLLLDGDKLTLCLNLSQEEVRPKELKTERGDRMTLFKLKRVMPK